MLTHMIEDSWKPYRVDGGAKLFADGWHTLFTDARAALTWADRFRAVLGVAAYNFYSSGEDVVENASANETVTSNIWEAIEGAVLRGEKGQHAWVAQEIAKEGSDSLLIGLLMGTQHGGWGYNRAYGQTLTDPPYWRALEPQAAVALGAAALRAEPFFKRFEERDDLFAYDGAVLYGPDQDATAAAEAGKPGTQYKVLAEAIPARSFAAAANAIDELTEAFNVDMMAMKNQGRWPAERLAKPFGTDWWHSDFRAVALLYTQPMWRKMVEIGALDECGGGC